MEGKCGCGRVLRGEEKRCPNCQAGEDRKAGVYKKILTAVVSIGGMILLALVGGKKPPKG